MTAAAAVPVRPVPSVEELREIAAAAGIDALGIAGVDPFLDTRAHLAARRAAGHDGGMGFTYRDPDRCTEPARLLRNARSLVVGARSYRAADEPAPGALSGRIGRYAWEDHYADLRAGLATVAARLRVEGWRAAVIADQNSLVDRAAAHRAGLGWYGKNTNLLLPGQGSWFVLGSVVTDAPLPPATDVQPDGCGPCRRCLDGCPTAAIVAPGVLDANRCLAWLVQAPGIFPAEFRAALGDRIYGCDDCQEVCPPNRRGDAAANAGVAVRIGRARDAWVPLLELLAASDEDVLARWGRWYLADRDPRWLRRNALLALGNVADPDDTAVRAALAGVLVHPDPMLRAHAVWAVRRLGVDDLLALVAGDHDEDVATELTRPVPRRMRSDR